MASEQLAALVRKTNPFEYQGAITRSELFFDRKVELEDAMVVCQQIVRGSTGGVVVFGGRGSGKTSFLNALKRSLDGIRIASAKISLDEGMVEVGQEPRLFKLMLTDLTTAAEASGLLERDIANKVKQLLQNVINIDSVTFEALGIAVVAKAAEDQRFSALPYAILRDGLKDFLRLLKPWETGKTPGAILILDEGDALTKNRVLLQVLRNVFQDTPGMGLVIAGTSKLLSEVSTVFSPIPRFFKKINLGPFTNDSDVKDAILKTTQLARNELLAKAIRLELTMHNFIPQVTELSGRAPLDFNMLSYLAYDIGSSRIRKENGTVTLFMRLDKEALEQAITQLRGTKEYAEFLDSLSEYDRVVLRLLSKCVNGASIDELNALLTLDSMGEDLRLATVDKIISQFDELTNRKRLTDDSLGNVMQLADKFSIRIVHPELADRPIYRVEDQWVKAYFKYAGVPTLVNLDLGMIASDSGILIFGDPVSSILDSIFLQRVVQSLEKPDPSGKPGFRVNSYPNDGLNLRSRIGKILNASFVRIADGNPWHLAFRTKLQTDTSGLTVDILRIMQKLREIGLLKNPTVRERRLNAPWS